VSKRKQGKPSPKAAPPAQPRRRLFGPAFTVSLVVAAVTVGYRLHVERSKAQPKPIVEHRVVSGDGAPSRFAPEVAVLLEESAGIKLASDQRTELEAIAQDWKQTSGSLKADLDRETERFREYADSQVGGGKADLTEFQRRAEPALELGRELANLKLQYWQRALKVLTPGQREHAEELRKNTLSPANDRK